MNVEGPWEEGGLETEPGDAVALHALIAQCHVVRPLVELAVGN